MERVALIDLGSNTARLVIYDVLDGGYFNVVDDERELVRLGDIDEDGNLKQTRILQAIETLKSFKKICSVYNADKVIAIATAAVRRAKNQKTFLNDVFNATGIRFKVITEEEEPYYVYQGVINSMDIPRGLIMEFGGGSTKIIYYNRRVVLHTHIFDFGGVNLIEQFGKSGKTNEQIADDMVHYVKSRLEEVEWLKELDPDTQFIGVGGSFRNLARICRKVTRYPLDMVHNYKMKVDDFNYVYNMIKGLDLEKKTKIKGLSSTRADIFPAALAATKAMVEHCGFETITSSGSGIREGIIFNYACPQTMEKPISDVVGHSIYSYLKKLNLNEVHAEQVYNLCVQLFKQLRVLHKFPRAYVKVLRIAALMSDVGTCVKFYNNPKHTAYFLLNSNLYGASHRDVVLSAFITAVHDKEEINYTEWATKYSAVLSEEDVQAVKKLAMILRLALAFDKSRASVVPEITCEVLGDSVIMKTELSGDAMLELKDAVSLSLDFKRVFKKNLEIL